MATKTETVKDEATGLVYIKATGLVPVEMLKSEAGLGLIAGEIRGVSPETAQRMLALKSARLVDIGPATSKPDPKA